MHFTTKLIWILTYFAHKKFLRACKDPVAAKQKQWQEIHQLLSKGSFWKGKLSDNLNDFPISDYESYRIALETNYSEKTSCLTGEEILFWSESGGTTGKSKIYPITQTFKKSFQSTTPPFLHGLCERFSNFLAEPVLYFAATLPKESSPAGIEKGFISGYNYRNIPPLLAKKYAFPIEIFRDRETFLQWGPLYALATDLSALIAITPSAIEQFAMYLEKNRSIYLKLLKENLSPGKGLPKPNPHPKRLEHLENFYDESVSFLKIWPSLQFLACWKSSTCGLQIPKLKKWLGNLPIVDATYSATEAWMTVPLENTDGGALHPEALIAEFILPNDPSRIFQAWELEVNKDYEILLTTKMGFVRYRLYDIVTCTGYLHKSPKLLFKEKAGNAVSLGQTRISETHILLALAENSLSLPEPWILAPNISGSRLLLHFPEAKKEQFSASLNALEKSLQKIVPDYAEDIRDGLLQEIALSPLPESYWKRETHAQTKPKVIQQKPVG